MNRRDFIGGAIGAPAVLKGLQGAGPERPNIIYFLLDDLGMHDTSCYGSKQIQTPNIDRLAAPARATLMTGKHMGQVSVSQSWRDSITIFRPSPSPQMLQKAGYSCGGFGKWGLGDLNTSVFRKSPNSSSFEGSCSI